LSGSKLRSFRRATPPRNPGRRGPPRGRDAERRRPAIILDTHRSPP